MCIIYKENTVKYVLYIKKYRKICIIYKKNTVKYVLFIKKNT